MIDSSLESTPIESARSHWTIGQQKLFALIVVPALVLNVLLIAQRLPLGIKDQWQWEYQESQPPWFTLLFPALAGPVVLFVALYAAERFDLRQFGRLGTWACLLMLAASGFLFRFFVQWIAVPTASGPAFAAATVASPTATSHFTVALTVRDVRTLIYEYPRWMARWPKHAKTHPPGTLLIYIAGHRAVEASPGLQKLLQRVFYADGDAAISSGLFGVSLMARTQLEPKELLAATFIAYLLPLIGALGVIPFFYFAARFLGEAWAWRAAVLLATLPSLATFMYAIDQVYFFLAVLFLAWIVAALDRNSPALALGAGMALGLATFTSYSLLPLALIAALMTALWMKQAEAPQRVGRLGGFVVVGFLAFYVALFLLFRFNPVATFRAALAAHHEESVQAMTRSYGKWLVANLFDFFYFVGVPVVALFAAWLAAPQAKLHAEAVSARWQFIAFVAFGATLFLLDLSGLVRGEVARIWMYLAVFPVAFAAARLRQEDEPQWSQLAWIIVCCLQLLQTALMQYAVGTGFLRPW